MRAASLQGAPRKVLQATVAEVIRYFRIVLTHPCRCLSCILCKEIEQKIARKDCYTLSSGTLIKSQNGQKKSVPIQYVEDFICCDEARAGEDVVDVLVVADFEKFSKSKK